MVKKAFSFLHREIASVNHAAYFLAALSLVSQFLALIRDRLFAAQFGADKTLDLYYAAFRIPDFIFVIVSSLVSVSVLIPLLLAHAERSKEEAKRFISTVFTAFFLGMVVIAGIAFLLVPYIIPRIFPSFAADHALLIKLTRLLLLSPMLLGLSNLFASVTQAHQRFIVYGLCPVLYNIGIIFGVLVLYPAWGPMGLGLGVVLGALLHALVQVPYLIGEGLLPTFIRLKDRVSLLRIAALSLPRTISLSLSEITELVLVVLAGTLAVGSISVFTLSWNLQSVPLSMIGVSYSIALFPVLSKLHNAGDKESFKARALSAIKHIFFLGALTVAVFVVVRAQIVRTAFGAGNFNWDDTRLTAAALAIFIASLVPQCLVLVFARAFYAIGDTKTPLFVNFFSAAVTVAASFGFMRAFNALPVLHTGIERVLRVADIRGTEVLMLPLAFSIGAALNAILLALFFGRRVEGFIAALVKPFFSHLGAFVITVVSSYGLLALFAPVFDVDTTIGVFLQGFLAGAGGLLSGIAFLLAIKNDEVREFLDVFVNRIFRQKKKAEIVGPDLSV